MSDDTEDKHRVWKDRRKNGQFGPGVSGNPKGRPRKSHSTKAIFEAMFRSKVPVRIGGKTVHLNVVEAMAERVKREALTGPLRGLEKGVLIAQKYSAIDPPIDEEPEIDLSRLSDEDLEVYGQLSAKAQGLDWEEFQAEMDALTGTQEYEND